MISNYRYLKRICVHSLIGVQWLGANCQIKQVRKKILLALNSRYPITFYSAAYSMIGLTSDLCSKENSVTLVDPGTRSMTQGTLL